MKVGLFDHLERSEDRALATQLDERLEFISAADEAGYYCLHVAEHHSSPLNMTSAASVWLAAVARATKRIRLGPLVYLLPLYSPLRLAEEICLLDHLSKGRLEVGIGRGVSPYEVGYHKIDHDQSREIFIDAWECLKAALADSPFSYKGPHYDYTDVPLPIRPLQQPHPAYWYGSSNEVGSTWAGEQGLHFASNGSTDKAKTNIDAFRAAFQKRGSALSPKAGFAGGAAIGLLRHIVVADTDEEARRIAKPAIEHHAASLNWLRNLHGSTEFTSRNNVHRGVDFESWEQNGMAIVGTPDTVLAEIRRQAEMLGLNYLIAYQFFGSMALSDAKRSLQLFSTEIMPALAEV